MFAEPRREFLLGKLAGGEREDGDDEFRIARGQAEAVEIGMSFSGLFIQSL